ncbi:MAG TPA: hypothetical protein DIW51_13250 [Rhodospirillaceae bacterium]|nr:hypothetical protein [Magnetovibrio sp.]HBT44429.1 hypothetical protein [Rhodospirillaceae bacterium]HCS70923.1 hypothetical protein [Rhodospirillaceae bacterium]|tara:strand:- start:58 stop:906 length:849 start_codon:yes stop_codon:yes gene_type:complete
MTAEPRKQEIDGRLATCLTALATDGYAVVPGHLGPATVTDLRARTDALWEEVKNTPRRGVPERDADDRVVYNLQNKDKHYIDLLVDPLVRGIGMAMLNDPYYRFLPPDAPNYILGFFNARCSGRPLDLHIDTNIPTPGDLTWRIQIAFALDDMTAANGCTVVVPKSHRSGAFTDRASKDIRPVECKAGDMVVWDSRLWHGAGANTSGGSRWLIIATLNRWWVKQSSDMTRSLPEDIYQSLSDEQKALLGFCSLPPRDERERINIKTGYDQLKPSVRDYWSTE